MFVPKRFDNFSELEVVAETELAFMHAAPFNELGLQVIVPDLMIRAELDGQVVLGESSAFSRLGWLSSLTFLGSDEVDIS